VIKSGGEWISSIDIENVAVSCPGVRIAAVIGIAHPKWEERPLLIVEPHHGATVKAADVLAHIAAQVAKWQVPDEVVFDSVPLTATGKIDKKALRQIYALRYS
jgi:fatty-acyl-CoA synthase